MPIAETTATAILVSRNKADPNPRRKIATLLCKYPLTIHNEVMTHRAFSRNTASSRAIPVKRLIESAYTDYAEPKYWFRNKPGMQGTEPMGDTERARAIDIWHCARLDAIRHAKALGDLEAHKQLANRLLGPYLHTFAVITATEWANFFGTRIHSAAEPAMRDLAIAMFDARNNAPAQELSPGEWHVPFVMQQHANKYFMSGEYAGHGIAGWLKASVAMSASTSYMTVEGQPMTMDKAVALYDKLLHKGIPDPLHASPFEHQAQADGIHQWPKRDDSRTFDQVWNKRELHGNFTGFIQYRKTIEGECFEE